MECPAEDLQTVVRRLLLLRHVAAMAVPGQGVEVPAGVTVIAAGGEWRAFSPVQEGGAVPLGPGTARVPIPTGGAGSGR